jgi:hypothetical protein
MIAGFNAGLWQKFNFMLLHAPTNKQTNKTNLPNLSAKMEPPCGVVLNEWNHVTFALDPSIILSIPAILLLY